MKTKRLGMIGLLMIVLAVAVHAQDEIEILNVKYENIRQSYEEGRELYLESRQEYRTCVAEDAECLQEMDHYIGSGRGYLYSAASLMITKVEVLAYRVNNSPYLNESEKELILQDSQSIIANLKDLRGQVLNAGSTEELGTVAMEVSRYWNLQKPSLQKASYMMTLGKVESLATQAEMMKNKMSCSAPGNDKVMMMDSMIKDARQAIAIAGGRLNEGDLTNGPGLIRDAYGKITEVYNLARSVINEEGVILREC